MAVIGARLVGPTTVQQQNTLKEQQQADMRISQTNRQLGQADEQLRQQKAAHTLDVFKFGFDVLNAINTGAINWKNVALREKELGLASDQFDFAKKQDAWTRLDKMAKDTGIGTLAWADSKFLDATKSLRMLIANGDSKVADTMAAGFAGMAVPAEQMDNFTQWMYRTGKIGVDKNDAEYQQLVKNGLEAIKSIPKVSIPALETPSGASGEQAPATSAAATTAPNAGVTGAVSQPSKVIKGQSAAADRSTALAPDTAAINQQIDLARAANFGVPGAVVKPVSTGAGMPPVPAASAIPATPAMPSKAERGRSGSAAVMDGGNAGVGAVAPPTSDMEKFRAFLLTQNVNPVSQAKIKAAATLDDLKAGWPAGTKAYFGNSTPSATAVVAPTTGTNVSMKTSAAGTAPAASSTVPTDAIPPEFRALQKELEFGTESLSPQERQQAAAARTMVETSARKSIKRKFQSTPEARDRFNNELVNIAVNDLAAADGGTDASNRFIAPLLDNPTARGLEKYAADLAHVQAQTSKLDAETKNLLLDAYWYKTKLEVAMGDIAVKSLAAQDKQFETAYNMAQDQLANSGWKSYIDSLASKLAKGEIDITQYNQQRDAALKGDKSMQNALDSWATVADMASPLLSFKGSKDEWSKTSWLLFKDNASFSIPGFGVTGKAEEPAAAAQPRLGVSKEDQAKMEMLKTLF